MTNKEFAVQLLELHEDGKVWLSEEGFEKFLLLVKEEIIEPVEFFEDIG